MGKRYAVACVTTSRAAAPILERGGNAASRCQCAMALASVSQTSSAVQGAPTLVYLRKKQGSRDAFLGYGGGVE